MLQKLDRINENAHIETVHPNALNWPLEISKEELCFISNVVFDRPGHEPESIAYITKELAQLAEIEKHVSAVLSIVLGELQAVDSDINKDHYLHHALTCFAAEELHHANMFYRYVRLLSSMDFKFPNNPMAERVSPYTDNDSPLVKLAALCLSAYIGESVITVFERRAKALDPERQYFITQLLHVHGLDEARHIKCDHYVFDYVIPSLSEREKQRMREILAKTEELNFSLAQGFEDYAKKAFQLDYTNNNNGYNMQYSLTQKFREMVFGGENIHKIDEVLSAEDKALLREFSKIEFVHK